jgi:hypothetical protein
MDQNIDLKNNNIEKNINIIIKKIEKPSIINYVKEDDFKNVDLFLNNNQKKIIPMNFFNIIQFYITLFINYINKYKIYIFIILLVGVLFLN